MANDWNSLDFQPPDEWLEVTDGFHIEIARPCYYNWKLIEGVVRRCHMYWDKTWMIKLKGIEISKIGDIIGWRKIETNG